MLGCVRAVTDHAVLVGLVDSLERIPGFQRGDALWREREVLALVFHVRVDRDCESSRNLVFVPLVVPPRIAAGVARRGAGGSPAILSCADGAGTEPDYVLSASDEARVNAQLAWLNAYVEAKADSLGFAYTDLGAVYAPAGVHDRFSVLRLMFSPWPFGPYVSVDGLHPSAAGSRALAEAAAQGIAARYTSTACITRVASSLGRARQAEPQVSRVHAC